MQKLAEALSKLEQATATDQSLQCCWHPGALPADLANLVAALKPLILPTEVVRLYEWHNGSEEPMNIVPGYRFLTASQALARYQRCLQNQPGSEGWNPLWFPLFSFQGNDHCCLLSLDHTESSPIYLSFNQETELFLTFRSLTDLVQASAECFATGAYVRAGEFLQSDEPAAHQVNLRFGNTFPNLLVDGVTTFSKFMTSKWPAEWRAAIGRKASDYIAKGATTSIADFDESLATAIIHARIAGIVGTSEGRVLRVDDSTGNLTLWCPAGVVGAREVQLGRRFEFEIGCCPDHNPVAQAVQDSTIEAHVTHVLALAAGSDRHGELGAASIQ